jgi:hypothetical protein
VQVAEKFDIRQIQIMFILQKLEVLLELPWDVHLLLPIPRDDLVLGIVEGDKFG